MILNLLCFLYFCFLFNQSEVVFDTLPTGKKSVKLLPGEIVKIPIEKKDTYLRTNFSESDNRSYRDGDLSSSRNYNRRDSNTEKSVEMYNSPKNTISTDQNGEIIVLPDDSNYRNTFIGDDVRVYKGGSWKDRAFWLDPSQRRYLPEYMATDFIGFRCAMSRVGSKSKNKKKKKN